MTATEEQRRVKALLEETIVLLCKNGLDYKSQFTVEALIGITLDQKNVILINIKETIFNDSCTEADLYEENMDPDKMSHTSNEHNGTRSEDEEFGYHEDLNPSTSSDSLNTTTQNNEYGSNLNNHHSSQNQAKSFTHTADESTPHTSQTNYNHTGNNENSQPISKNQDRQTSSQQKRSLHPFADGKVPSNDNHQIGKHKHQKTSMNTSGEINPLSSRNTADENASRNHPLNVHMFKSEPPDFEEQMPNAIRDNFNIGLGNNNVASGSLNMKWHPDELLSDLSNMVHNTGLGRPPLLSGKEGSIEGISSLLNLPLQSQSHLSHSLPPNMSAANPAMGLASPSSHFLDSSASRPNFLHSHGSGPKARYKCSLCFKEVRLLRDLRAHMATKHNLEKDFSCSVCGTGFTYKHNLFVHLRTVHKLNDRLMPTPMT